MPSLLALAHISSTALKARCVDAADAVGAEGTERRSTSAKIESETSKRVGLDFGHIGSRLIAMMKPFSFALGVFAGVLALATNAVAESSKCPSSDILQLQTELRAADQAMSGSEYLRANDIAELVIRKIGDRYIQQITLDDSGQRLSLADALQRRGDLKVAANIRIGTARARLDLLTQKFGC